MKWKIASIGIIINLTCLVGFIGHYGFLPCGSYSY